MEDTIYTCSLQLYARSCKFVLDHVIVYYVLFGAKYLEELELGKDSAGEQNKYQVGEQKLGQYVACNEIPNLRENVLWVLPLHICQCCFELQKSKANHRFWQVGFLVQ